MKYRSKHIIAKNLHTPINFWEGAMSIHMYKCTLDGFLPIVTHSFLTLYIKITQCFFITLVIIFR
jgi:hypothetical protein